MTLDGEKKKSEYIVSLTNMILTKMCQSKDFSFDNCLHSFFASFQHDTSQYTINRQTWKELALNIKDPTMISFIEALKYQGFFKLSKLRLTAIGEGEVEMIKKLTILNKMRNQPSHANVNKAKQILPENTKKTKIIWYLPKYIHSNSDYFWIKHTM